MLHNPLMSIITPIPPDIPWYQRVFLKIPVVGWIARDVLFGDRDNAIWFAVIVVSLWLFAVARWGVFALLVPFVLVLLPVPLLLYTLLVRSFERKRARRGEGQPRG